MERIFAGIARSSETGEDKIRYNREAAIDLPLPVNFMKINLMQGKNFELTDAIRQYVQKKLIELDKFIPEGMFASIDLEFERTTHHHRKGDVFRAEANISVPSTTLYAQAQEEDLYAAIDKLKDEVQRELKDYKDKLRQKQKKAGRAAKEETRLSDLAK